MTDRKATIAKADAGLIALWLNDLKAVAKALEMFGPGYCQCGAHDPCTDCLLEEKIEELVKARNEKG